MSSFHPNYTPPSYQSPAGPSHVPEITAAAAARGLGDKLPYSGGALATHKNFGIAGPAGYKQSRAPHLPGTHSYANGMEGAHVIHEPRFVG